MKDSFTIIKTGRFEITKIAINDILYLKAFGNYTDIFLESGRKLTICQNIKQTLNHINSTALIRICRSIAVNKAKIIRVRNGKNKTIKIITNEELCYSTNYITNPNELLV